MIQVTNKSHAVRIYNLTHAEFCANGGKCRCRSIRIAQFARTADGVHGLQHTERQVPDVLTILSGATVALDDAVLKVPPIARDIAAGILRLHPKSPAPAPRAAAPVAPSPPVSYAVPAEPAVEDPPVAVEESGTPDEGASGSGSRSSRRRGAR